MNQHITFATTGVGLQRSSPPMRLFEKAKRFGIWNPSDIDFRTDAQQWRTLNQVEQEAILSLTALFQAGEEAVTGDIVPLMLAISREGRVEEELYLTAFVFEEAKHTDFFRRFLDEVVVEPGDLTRFHSPSYHELIYTALPAAMQRLLTDASAEAQMCASVTYNMIVEGVLAETGYHAFSAMLERNNLLPGQRRGIRLIKQDESRHIAYGIFLISRLLAENPRLWDLAEATMNNLLVPAMGVVAENFALFPEMPFGLDQSEFTDYALVQFQKRLDRLERARGASLEEVYAVTEAAIEQDDA